MATRLTRIRVWVRALGAQGALTNARSELERRAHEHAVLDELERRIPGEAPVAAAAA